METEGAKAAVLLRGVGKDYRLYDRPGDRLREALHPFGRVYHRLFTALDRIDLRVDAGEIIGIVGENGCGKSTLLKIIAAVLNPAGAQYTPRAALFPCWSWALVSIRSSADCAISVFSARCKGWSGPRDG